MIFDENRVAADKIATLLKEMLIPVRGIVNDTIELEDGWRIVITAPGLTILYNGDGENLASSRKFKYLLEDIELCTGFKPKTIDLDQLLDWLEMKGFSASKDDKRIYLKEGWRLEIKTGQIWLYNIYDDERATVKLSNLESIICAVVLK